MGVERKKLSQSCLKEPASCMPHPAGKDGAECGGANAGENADEKHLCPGHLARHCRSSVFPFQSVQAQYTGKIQYIINCSYQTQFINGGI